MTTKIDTSQLVVVTGATGGIGRQICHQAASAGHNIVAHFHSADARVSDLEEDLKSLGARCWAVQADLASALGVEALVAEVEAILDSNESLALRGLVNNAAKLLGPSFDEATVEQFDSYFAVNTRAPFFLAQRLSRRMTRGASIVNISSASAHFSSPGDIVYAMSKSALESMTLNMAEAVAAKGIRANTVVPGFTNNGHAAFSNPQVRAYMETFAVLGEVSSPSHVAEAVMFLLSDASSRTTGAVIDVSGGSTIGARGTRAHSVRDLL